MPLELSDTVPAISDVEPGLIKVKVSVVTEEEDSCSLKLAVIAEFTSTLIDPSSGLVPVIAGGVVSVGLKTSQLAYVSPVIYIISIYRYLYISSLRVGEPVIFCRAVVPLLLPEKTVVKVVPSLDKAMLKEYCLSFPLGQADVYARVLSFGYQCLAESKNQHPGLTISYYVVIYDIRRDVWSFASACSDRRNRKIAVTVRGRWWWRCGCKTKDI